MSKNPEREGIYKQLGRADAARLAQEHLAQAVEYAESAGEGFSQSPALYTQLGNLHARIGLGYAQLASVAEDA